MDKNRAMEPTTVLHLPLKIVGKHSLDSFQKIEVIQYSDRMGLKLLVACCQVR